MPWNYQQLAPSVQFENQLASSLYSVGFILPGSRSTVGFITRDFHALISRQHSQTNQHGLYTLFLTSKSRCMQNISSVDALLTTQNVLSRSGRFGGSHTGWSQLQLASSVSPLWRAGITSARTRCWLLTSINRRYFPPGGSESEIQTYFGNPYNCISESSLPILVTAITTRRQGAVVIQNIECSLSGIGNVLCCAVIACMNQRE